MNPPLIAGENITFFKYENRISVGLNKESQLPESSFWSFAFGRPARKNQTIGLLKLTRRKEQTIVNHPRETTATRTPLTPIERILTPLQKFAAQEASGGFVLIFATIAALVWANWGPEGSYHHFFENEFGLSLGDWSISKSLHHWINDGLMAIFFFVVGLEIKRELIIGELSAFRKAALPVAGALGGMVVPAGLYWVLNAGSASQSGWGIPMATDIAFVIGVLTLLGSRVPASLKVFLVALAIVDDIGAVLVIALFYTAQISTTALLAAGVITSMLLVLSWLGTRHPIVYGVLGIGLWLALLQSGIHATIAGVVLALTVPASTRITTGHLIDAGHHLLNQLKGVRTSEGLAPTTHEEQNIIAALEGECERAETPMQRLERDAPSLVGLFHHAAICPGKRRGCHRFEFLLARIEFKPRGDSWAWSSGSRSVSHSLPGRRSEPA